MQPRLFEKFQILLLCLLGLTIVHSWNRVSAAEFFETQIDSYALPEHLSAHIKKMVGARSFENSIVLKMSGKIGQQSADKIELHIRSIRSASKDTLIILDISGPGGLSGQTFQIVDLIHKSSRILTLVRAENECLSSCALVFMAGVDAEYKPLRVIEEGAKLGFHGLGNREAETFDLINPLINSMGDARSRSLRLLEDPELGPALLYATTKFSVNRSIFLRNFAKGSSNDFQYIRSENDARQLGINYASAN